MENIEAPSMSTMRSQIPKNSDGSNSSASNLKSCYIPITAAMVDSLVKCRQIARERAGPASNAFSSVEECLEVVIYYFRNPCESQFIVLLCVLLQLCIDPLWMNSVLLLNKDICSEYRHVVRTLLKADANYSFTWPDSSCGTEPFYGPGSTAPGQLYNRYGSQYSSTAAEHKQFYPYQEQQMTPQWNYMYYNPISPQPPIAAANVVYSSPKVVPVGVPYIPVEPLPSSPEEIVHSSSYTESSEIKYRKPCEFRKPDVFHRPLSAAQESVHSAEAAPVTLAVTEHAATKQVQLQAEESSAPSSEESNQGGRHNSASSHPEIQSN